MIRLSLLLFDSLKLLGRWSGFRLGFDSAENYYAISVPEWFEGQPRYSYYEDRQAGEQYALQYEIQTSSNWILQYRAQPREVEELSSCLVGAMLE